MRIEVTAADIANGRPEDDCGCPVSLAIRRATGIPSSVSFSMVVIDYATPWQTTVYLPDEAEAFIERFDKGRPVEPLAFDLPFDPATHAKHKTAKRAKAKL